MPCAGWALGAGRWAAPDGAGDSLPPQAEGAGEAALQGQVVGEV